MKTMALISLAALPVLMPAAHASDDALKTYKHATDYGLVSCRGTYLLAQAKAKYTAATGKVPDARGSSDVGQCIEQHSVLAKEKLVPVLDDLKTDEAKKALKAYHVAFVSALRGIDPGATELQISYDQRQQALRGKVTQAWAAFELEQ